MKILLIERNSKKARHFREILEANPNDRFGLLYVENTTEADHYLRRLNPDLLVVDLEEMNRNTIQLFIQKHRDNTPVIVIGKQSHETLARELIGIGAQDFLTTEHLTYPWLKRSILNSTQRFKSMFDIRMQTNMLTVCSYCKDVSNEDENRWERIESYIGRNTGVNFSHGICPSCANFHFPQVFGKCDQQVAG